LNKDDLLMEKDTSVNFVGDSDGVVDVLLICALKDEYDQVLMVTDGLQKPGWVERKETNGWIVADGKFDTASDSINIRASWATHMGRESTQAIASRLINANPAHCLAMSGICAGRRDKVALGDVIFAERMWSYDAGKLVNEKGEQHFHGDPVQYRPPAPWVHRMQYESPPSSAEWLDLRPRLPLEHQENWALLCFLANVDPRDHVDFRNKCPNWSAVLTRLMKRGWLKEIRSLRGIVQYLFKGRFLEKTLNLTTEGQETAEKLKSCYPHGLPEPAAFKVHIAPIATGAAVTEDPDIFSRLSPSMRKVLGVEMEASAIAALGEVNDMPVIVAKGVSDYGDHLKDDRYRDFAARASAECLIGLLRNATDLLGSNRTENSTAILTLVQEGFTSLQERLDVFEPGLDMHSGLHGGSTLAEHHGTDALHELHCILKRRTSYDQDTLGELNRLVIDTGETGKFCATTISIRVEIYNWIARVAASTDLLEEAEKSIAMVAELGGQVSPIALAWCDVVRGDPNAGLQSLRDSHDADSQSNLFAILRKKKGIEEALAYFDFIENISPEQFTAIGWKNVVGCLAEADRVVDATKIYSFLPDDYVADCPLLGYIGGIVCAARLVPEDHRHRVVIEEFLAASEHLLEGGDTDQWRQSACDAFKLSIDAARDVNDRGLEKSAAGWLRWLRLIDPIQKQDELALLINDTNDGRKAVEVIPLAVALRVEFNPAPLEKHLMRLEALGGLSPKELNARFLLLRYFKRYHELASFIEDNWEKLIGAGSAAALGGALIHAYVSAGECGRADKVLTAKEADLYHFDVPWYRLMIDQCRGEDPTQRAMEIYESSETFEDLWSLVNGLEMGQRWAELMPYALILFEKERNAENALRYIECLRRTKAPKVEVTNFLQKSPDLVDLNAELKSVQAWALYSLGEVEEARKLNNQLLDERRNINDLGLDINLAIRMGEWERFADIIAREWECRSELPAHALLHLAKLAGWGAKEKAILLAEEAVGQLPDDPNILVQAYSIAIALARDDIAMPWINKAAQLSITDEGPVSSHSFTELIEMMKDRREDWKRKNDLFRNAKIPMHWAASILNVPLSRFLIAIPRENKAQSDPRKRYPVPVRSGAREPIDMVSVRKVLLDITSIIILCELGHLSRVINSVDEVYLSPHILEILLQERDKVTYHQPSRVNAVKPLLEMYRNGDLKLAEEKAPDTLIEEVGVEIATLLGGAKRSKGLCIHSGKLYRVGSYLEDEADIGEFVDYLTSPSMVAHALHGESRITTSTRDEALTYLKQVANGETSGVEISSGTPIFLDTVSVQYLANTGLLSELVNTGRQVFVHSSTVEEWKALVDTEPHTVEIVNVLDNIRQVLRTGMTEGKVKFIREGQKDEDDERSSVIEMPVIDLLEDVSYVDALCIDDRFLNSMPFLEDRKGNKAPVCCSLDMVNMLLKRAEITDVEYSDAIHLMREWTLFALPVDEGELFQLLSVMELDESGESSESAELRVIREYLARLHSADVLCTAQDLNYLDGLWRAGQSVVSKLWADETSELEVIEARADWVIEHIIPDIELAMRFVPDREERLEQIAITRLQVALSPPDIPAEHRQVYTKWLDRKFVAPNFPANSHIINIIAEQTSQWVVERAKEVVNELEKSGYEDTD